MPLRLRALVLFGLIGQAQACRTSTPATGAAAVKDFDTGANATLSIDFDPSIQTFCPNAQKFNMANAYWMTLASTYSYATKDNVSAVVERLKPQSPSLRAEFIASPDSSNPLTP